jgi:endoglucanase
MAFIIDYMRGKRSVGVHFIVMCTLLVMICSQPSAAQTVPFNRGVNLTNWFQVSNAEQIQFMRYTKTDFEQIKSLGCDVIRLPINLHAMTNGAPDYIIDPLFYSFLDQAVSWAEALNINLILDNHTFDVNSNTDPQIGTVLTKVWTQMAGHYKNSTGVIYYEILNEPHGIADDLWNSIQQQVIDAIRKVDTDHYIIVGPANWNSYNNLNAMPVYNDSKLIYTFHFYDPFIFTHQGASWVNPSMVPLAGVPFPYKADSMPPFPASLKGSWIESAFNDYANTGNAASVKALIDLAVQFRNSRNVPVYCGEFGVYMPNSSNYHRTLWYETVRKYLEEKGIAWTTWDYHGGFGLFKAGSNGLFKHDLNIPLLKSLGLTVPEQSAYIQKPDSTGFLIYTDFIESQIFESSYGSGALSFYAKDQPNNGEYCISWNGADRYNAVGFDFIPDKDLSGLVNEGYALDFMVRGNTASTAFDVRFIDTKTAVAGDHPWRMRVTIDAGTTSFDNRWHHLFIPLNTFAEQGAWDNGWFNPEGKFDWTAVDRMEIASEEESMVGINLWFDNMQITNLDTARVLVTSPFTGITSVKTPPVVRSYPNPFTDDLYIVDEMNTPLQLTVYDYTGRIRIRQMILSNTRLNTSGLPAGFYLLRITDGNESVTVQKLVKI